MQSYITKIIGERDAIKYPMQDFVNITFLLSLWPEEAVNISSGEINYRMSLHSALLQTNTFYEIDRQYIINYQLSAWNICSIPDTQY